MPKSRLEILTDSIDESILYTRQQIHINVFRAFIEKFYNPETRAVAVKKWVEMAGIEEVDGKTITRSGMFKEVELTDDDGNVIDIIPPLMGNNLGLDSAVNIDHILSENSKKNDVYGVAGDSELNFKIMEMSKELIDTDASTWADLVEKYIVKNNPGKEPEQQTDENDIEEYYD